MTVSGAFARRTLTALTVVLTAVSAPGLAAAGPSSPRGGVSVPGTAESKLHAESTRPGHPRRIGQRPGSTRGLLFWLAQLAIG